MWVNTQSDIISKVLSPAVRLFLRSSVEQIEDLDVQIQGHDRQILRGYIPGVRLGVASAIYQGLHLGRVKLQGENIRLNIGQVLRGKPLQLLEPIRVRGEVKIDETKLNDSIESPLLASALTDLLILFLQENGVSDARDRVKSQKPRWTKATLHDGYFRVAGTLENGSSIALAADLKLENPRSLTVIPRHLDGLPEWSAIAPRPFTLDLGTDVEIEDFALIDRTFFCQGRLSIRP